MILSQSCEHGIRALVYMARHDEAEYHSIEKIADRLQISFHFLTKILQRLTRRKILRSYRGPNGGIKLAKPAGEITVYEVITGIDGTKLFENCVLGLSTCDDAQPCPFHKNWIRYRTKMLKEFQNLTLRSLLDQTNKFKYRI